MRFYQLHTHTNGGNSNGYRWFTSRAEADKAQREDAAADPSEPVGTIEPVDIVPTKAGILAALRGFAGHPDNG